MKVADAVAVVVVSTEGKIYVHTYSDSFLLNSSNGQDLKTSQSQTLTI